MGTYEADFRGIVLRGVSRALTQLQQSNGALPSDQLRQRAWMALDYALDLPEAWPTTLELLLRLAPKLEQAGQRHHWLPFLTRGLAYSQRIAAPGAEAALRVEIGWLQQLLGNLNDARAHLEHACTWLRRAGDPEQLATALDRLAEVARQQRRYAECQQLIEELLAGVAADSPSAAYGYFVLGKAAFDQAQRAEAEAYFRRALVIWRPIDARHAALCIQNLGRIAWRRAEYSAAVAYFEEAITIFCEQQDVANRALAQMNLGIVYWARGEITTALHYYCEAITVFREIGHTLHLAMVYNNAGLAHATIAQWAEAEEYYRLSIALWAKLGDTKLAVDPQIGLATVYTHQARLPEALALFAATAEQLQQVDPMQKDTDLWLELHTNWHAAQRLAAVSQ